MKKSVALIFGYKGGIGQATAKAMLDCGHRIIPVDRTILDFDTPNADLQTARLLQSAQPDVIINCTGVFENGFDHTHHTSMNVNFGSNWSIVKYYAAPDNQKKKHRVIMVGSSCYDQGRRLYPLYSASKAALYNLWQSAQDALQGTNIYVDLVNPVRTLTKMSTANKTIDNSLPYLRPEQVAETIAALVKNDQAGACVNMNFEETM